MTRPSSPSAPSAPVPRRPNADWLRAQPSWPFFCEENVAWLCRDAPWPTHALVVGNPDRSVAMWGSSASARPDGLILWDYHVVGVAIVDDIAVVLDHACAVATVMPLDLWLRVSFRSRVASSYLPRFRRFHADEYLKVLCSDRRHMRDDVGQPLHPFPPWPGPREAEGSTVMALTTFSRTTVEDDVERFGEDIDDVVALARAFGLDDVSLAPYDPSIDGDDDDDGDGDGDGDDTHGSHDTEDPPAP